MKNKEIEEFDTINDLLTTTKYCPVCKNKLQASFCDGKYNDLLYFNTKKELYHHRYKNCVIVKRTMTLEGQKIRCKYRFDKNNPGLTVSFRPSEDEIVEKGVINIWRVCKYFQSNIFYIQTCPEHYRKINMIEIDKDEDQIDSIYCFDDFFYIPTFKEENELYCVHRHRSPASKRRESIFIQRVMKDQKDNIDPKRGGIWLEEDKDRDYMEFDISDIQKFSRRLGTLHALRG